MALSLKDINRSNFQHFPFHLVDLQNNIKLLTKQFFHKISFINNIKKYN
jgi:hypothetical protein